jgi:hypothetical protein
MKHNGGRTNVCWHCNELLAKPVWEEKDGRLIELPLCSYTCLTAERDGICRQPDTGEARRLYEDCGGTLLFDRRDD